MKRIYFTGERELEGIKWAAKVVDFGVSLSDSVAIDEMYSALYYIRQRKDLYKHDAKMRCNLAINSAENRMKRIKALMKSQTFWTDYSDKVIDEAKNDVTMFRIAIKSELDKLNIADSEMLSYVECARVLLDMSVKQFDEVMAQGKKKFGRDFTPDFQEYRMYDAYFHWDRMCDYISKGISADLNTPQIHGAFDAMCKKFADGTYVNPCLVEASKNNPDFLNGIVVMEDKYGKSRSS